MFACVFWLHFRNYKFTCVDVSFANTLKLGERIMQVQNEHNW